MGKYSVADKGIYNALCQRCRVQYLSNMLRKEWTGLWVCDNCFETRHPQELARPVFNDVKALPWVSLDDPDNSQTGFLGITDPSLIALVHTATDTGTYGNRFTMTEDRDLTHFSYWAGGANAQKTSWINETYTFQLWVVGSGVTTLTATMYPPLKWGWNSVRVPRTRLTDGTQYIVSMSLDTAHPVTLVNNTEQRTTEPHMTFGNSYTTGGALAEPTVLNTEGWYLIDVITEAV
jgi:hypothetical protein